MAPPLGLTLSMSGLYSRSQASTTEANASLISMTSMSSSVSFALARTSCGGRDGRGQHDLGVVGGDGEGVEAGPRAEPERRRPLLAHDQHGRRAVGDLRRGARGHGARLGERRPERGQLLQRGVTPDALVAREQAVHVARARHVGMRPGPRGGRSRCRSGPRRWPRAARWCDAQRELVHLLAADLPAPRDLLGALALVDEVEALEVERPVGLARARLGGRPDRHPAHRLHAGTDHHVHGARHHRLGGEVDGLLGRPALAVDRGPGHRLGEPGGEGRVARDVHRLLAHRHGAAHDHVLHQRGVEVVADQQGGEGLGGQVGGVPARERAAAAPHRGADGIDDHCIRHTNSNSDAESDGVPDGAPGRRDQPGTLIGEHTETSPAYGHPTLARPVPLCEIRDAMDLTFSAEQEAFRAEARAWLAAHVPSRPPPLARYGRGLRGAPRLGTHHVRGPLVRRQLAGRVRRPRRSASSSGSCSRRSTTGPGHPRG